MAWSQAIHDEIENMFVELIVFDQRDMKGLGMGFWEDRGPSKTLEEIKQGRIAAGKKAAESPKHYRFGNHDEKVVYGLMGVHTRTGRTVEEQLKARNTAFILALQGCGLNEIRRRTKVGYDEVRRIMMKAGAPIGKPGGDQRSAKRKKMLEESNV